MLIRTKIYTHAILSSLTPIVSLLATNTCQSTDAGNTASASQLATSHGQIINHSAIRGNMCGSFYTAKELKGFARDNPQIAATMVWSPMQTTATQ